MVEGLFRRFRQQGMSDDDAFKHSVECITGEAVLLMQHEGALCLSFAAAKQCYGSGPAVEVMG